LLTADFANGLHEVADFDLRDVAPAPPAIDGEIEHCAVRMSALRVRPVKVVVTSAQPRRSSEP